MTRNVSLEAVEAAIQNSRMEKELRDSFAHYMDCAGARVAAIAAIRALPPEPEGVVVATGKLRYTDGRIWLDDDALEYTTIAHQALDAALSKLPLGSRVEIVVRTLTALGESNE